MKLNLNLNPENYGPKKKTDWVRLIINFTCKLFLLAIKKIPSVRHFKSIIGQNKNKLAWDWASSTNLKEFEFSIAESLEIGKIYFVINHFALPLRILSLHYTNDHPSFLVNSKNKELKILQLTSFSHPSFLKQTNLKILIFIVC